MQLAEFGSKVLLLFGQLAALGSTARLAVSAGSWAPSAVLPAGPMEKVHCLHRLVLETEEARSIMQAYDKLMADMDAYEKATVQDWCNLISAISDQKLKQPLMRYEQRVCSA